MVGGLSSIVWKDVRMILPYALIGVAFLFLLPNKLNILMLGDEVATGLGVSVERTRFAFIILSSLLAGAAVSVVGLLGFVGLIVPHMTRLFIGSDYRYLFPGSIIGPNGSGKSTLIKSLSRCLKPSSGKVIVDGINVNAISTKNLAKKMAILPQVKHISGDIAVKSLVSYGRYPHLGFGKRLDSKDWEIIDWAIEKTGLTKLKDRNVMTLSGGERQRAWIAMALAQKPEILILDGKICNYGKPKNIIKSKLLKDIFRIEAHVYEDEVNCCPYFIPHKMI